MIVKRIVQVTLASVCITFLVMSALPTTADIADEPPPPLKRIPIEGKVYTGLCPRNEDTTPNKNPNIFTKYQKFKVSTKFHICIFNPTNETANFNFTNGHIFDIVAMNEHGKIVWRYPSNDTVFEEKSVNITIDPVYISIKYGRDNDAYEIGTAEWKDQPDGDFYIWPTIVGYNLTRAVSHQYVDTACDFINGCTFTVEGYGWVYSIPEPKGPDKDTDDNQYQMVLGVSSITGIVILCSMVSIIETTRYSALGLLAPLYSRLRKHMVLDHFSRGQIHGFIEANPGVHMNAIRDKFNLNNGAVAYHLKVLSREGYIISRRDGLKRRFYPSDRLEKQFKEEKIILTVIQSLLLSHIKKSPGINQTELAKLANTSAQVVNYHIKKLARNGIVTLKSDGRITKCYIVEKELDKYKSEPINKEKDPVSHRSSIINVD